MKKFEKLYENVNFIESIIKKYLIKNKNFLKCFKSLKSYCLPYGGKNPLYKFKYSLDDQGYLNDYYYEFDHGIVVELNVKNNEIEIFDECLFDAHLFVEDDFYLDDRVLDYYGLDYHDLELNYEPLEFRYLKTNGVKILLVLVDKSLREAKEERGVLITDLYKKHWNNVPKITKEKFLGVTWSHGLATGYDGNHNVTIKEMLQKALSVQGKEICVAIEGQEIGPMGLYFKEIIPEIAFSNDVWSKKAKNGSRYVDFIDYPHIRDLIAFSPRNLEHPWKRSCEAWIVPHKNRKFTFWVKRWFLEKIKEEGGEELENLNKLFGCFEVEIIE